MVEYAFDDERLSEIFSEQVPSIGKADNLLGEIVRAWSRIMYRWVNDGDQLGVDYGKETCNAAGRFLADKIEELDYLQDIVDREDNGELKDDEDYEELLKKITQAVRKFVDENYDDLLNTPQLDDYMEAFYVEECDTEVWMNDDQEEDDGWLEEDNYDDEDDVDDY